MNLIPGYTYTLKRGIRHHTVILEALTNEADIVIVRDNLDRPFYVNPSTLRINKQATLEAKLCEYGTNTSDLWRIPGNNQDRYRISKIIL